MDSALYLSELDTINARARELRKLRRSILDTTYEDRVIRQTESMLEYLETSSGELDTADSELFTMLIDCILLTEQREIRVRLKNGLELAEMLREEVV